MRQEVYGGLWEGECPAHSSASQYSKSSLRFAKLMNHQKKGKFTTFVPQLTDFIFIAVFCSALVSGSQMLTIDSDLGRHLAIGNYILEKQSIPTRDLFSHTFPNQSRPPYEWLSQTLFALANRLLGLDGVIIFTGIVIALTFALVFQFANHRRGSPILTFLITFLAIGASSIHWLPRPHIITFFLLVIWIENLEQVSKGKPIHLVVFPLIMLFWANLHGGFIFGILAWCAYFAGWLFAKWQNKADGQTGWNLLIVGVTSLATSMMTPDLWRNWEAVLNNRSSFILSRTIETMPPNLLSASMFPFTLLLGMTVILFLINYKTLSARHFFLLAGLGVASLSMARNIPLFAIACIPIVCELAKTSFIRLKTWGQIEERFSGFGRQSGWHILPFAVTFLAVLFFANQYLRNQQTSFHFNPQVFPVQAMNWLETHPQEGKMLNEFNWGGYILYRSWPQQRVFLDSQSDFYGEAFMKEYEQIMSAEGDWESLLGKYQVGWAVIPPGWPLTKELIKQGWKTAYQDQTAIILTRK